MVSSHPAFTIITARQRVLREDNAFTGVRLSVHSGSIWPLLITVQTCSLDLTVYAPHPGD